MRHPNRAALCALMLIVVSAPPAPADELRDLLAPLDRTPLLRMPLGVTRKGTPITAFVPREALDPRSPKQRLLLVGGLDGSRQSVERVLAVLQWFHDADDAAPWRQGMTLASIPCANPDGFALDEASKGNGAGGDPVHGYPPAGAYYNSPTDPESRYLWRWIGMLGPDVLIVAEPGRDEREVVVARHADAQREPEQRTTLWAQAADKAMANVGTVHGVATWTDLADGPSFARLLQSTADEPRVKLSPARAELRRRVDRSPLETARTLGDHYGHDLNQVAYIPAVALLGRLHLGQLTNDPSHVADVKRIAQPYVAGDKPALSARPSGPNLAAHLVFGELARLGHDADANRRLVERAASAAFDDDGQPRDAVPSHSEMSDAVFMACPILARAGAMTGDPRYFEACLRHLRFMRRLCVRDDGLYRHSPLDEAAWGRGNGFPALGLALTLSEMPADHPLRAEVLDAFRAHIEALSPHQDATGMWHQIIDRPESYRELSATCMITFAVARGVRRGWLDREQHEPNVRRAWPAINARVADDGSLVDVCTGTGKQRSLRAYYDRPAILGRDARGGAMALLAATEVAALEASR
jgi:rhamnogalacturonyl hydrolase YesR